MEIEPKSVKKTSQKVLNLLKGKENICLKCGEQVKYYHGVLGYEAMVCKKCGGHYT